MARTCSAGQCSATCGDTELMCRPHWFKVSKPTRDQVWREYRRKPLSTEHIAAIRAAIKEANEA